MLTVLIYLAVQAVIGIIAIEFAFKKCERFMQPDEERDAQVPHFRRLDAKNWTRWKFYPGAMFLMPTRLVLLMLDAAFLVLVCSVLSIGHSFKKGPMPDGCRKKMIQFFFYVCCSFYLFVAGFTTSLKEVDVDYSHYLGANYKRKSHKDKKTSTIVCNHVSWIDSVALIKHVRPAFTPSQEWKNAPVLSSLLLFLDSIFIPRGGSVEKKA
jgi:hypothetical protein